MHMTINVKK